MGLGYTPSISEKDDDSLLSQLFENNIIPHKEFSQKYKSEYNGQFTIREIPEDVLRKIEKLAI